MRSLHPPLPNDNQKHGMRCVIEQRQWDNRFTKLDKIRNERISGGNRKERTGKDVEVVWACDEKKGALRTKEGDGNESTREKEERKT